MKGKIAYIPQARTLEFHEFELPDVGPGAILAQVTRTNVCGVPAGGSSRGDGEVEPEGEHTSGG